MMSLQAAVAGRACCPPLRTRQPRLLARLPPRPSRVVAASGEPPEPPQEPKPAEDESRTKRVREVESSLKKMGVDKATAQRILQIWKASGATSPEGLRKLFLRRSVTKSSRIVLQLFVDLAAGLGAYYAARSLTQEELGTWTLAAKSGMYFLGMYLLIGASFEFFSLLALLYSTARYSTNADAFLLAVQEIAGASSGLSVVDQARQAINIVKVLGALDQIRDLLKGSTAEGDSESFFENLGIYLTLERAQRLYGFEAERYGLDDAAAADIAAVFARYDTNDDGYISLSEFRRLCNETPNIDLSEAEVAAAFDLLDTDKSNTLDFGEWVEWWLQTARNWKKKESEAAVAGEGGELLEQAKETSQ